MSIDSEVTEAIDGTDYRARLRVGTTLRNKWRLDVLLGVGGMAAVYAGTHATTAARAAIKVLHAELNVHASIRSRFAREGRAANTIGHPGVVKVLDEDTDDDGSAFLVMELLDGESLEARAARHGGRLPVDEVVAIADQLLDVLIAAHAKDIVHRDLKPENVFLTRDGHVRVLDFGIARLREAAGATNATRTGTMMGTPAYMAPEQARGLWDEVDGRTDLWAVGATMFALLTGQPAHRGRTANEILVAACTTQVPPVRSVAADVPQPVADVVDRALAFGRDARWPDARTMQDAGRRAYEAMHSGVPISSASGSLIVPASVRDRTLASAPDGVGVTVEPVSRTAASVLRTISSVPKVAWIGVAATLGAVMIVGIVVARSTGSASTATSAAAAIPPAAVSAAPAPPPAPLTPDALPVESAPAASAAPSAATSRPKPSRGGKRPAPVVPAKPPSPAPVTAPAPKLQVLGERSW